MIKPCKINNCNGKGKKDRHGKRYMILGMCQIHYGRQQKGMSLSEDGLHHIKDGKSKNPMYRLWCNMRQRCNDVNVPNYSNYGGRGIKVCDRWQGKYGFANFLEDIGERPSLRYSLDRIDNNGDYTPENCRWATPQEQALNRRSNRLIVHKGISKTILQWSSHLGIKRTTLSQRLDTYGWSIEKCLETPVRKRG